MTRRETGVAGEKVALNYLKKHGYRIVETNYRNRFGEIDIIARHKNYFVFVEVRSKKSRDYGSPEESITPVKARHLRAAARFYYQSHVGLPEDWRIDVIAVELDEHDKPERINLIQNAIEDD